MSGKIISSLELISQVATVLEPNTFFGAVAIKKELNISRSVFTFLEEGESTPVFIQIQIMSPKF
jgi:hypothetical protein